MIGLLKLLFRVALVLGITSSRVRISFRRRVWCGSFNQCGSSTHASQSLKPIPNPVKGINVNWPTNPCLACLRLRLNSQLVEG